jgi:hypothetical protein
MRNLLWLLPLAAFLLNPNLACSDEPQFQYGAAEMRAAVEGDWSLTLTLESGALPVTIHVEQAATAPLATAGAQPRGPLLRPAHACGTRTLVKGAGACGDQSVMPLAVTYVSGDAAFASVPMSGQFMVYGLLFGTGDMTLTIGTYVVVVPVNADGSFGDPRLSPPTSLASVTIDR